MRVPLLILAVAALVVPAAASRPLERAGLPERQIGFDDSPSDWSPSGLIAYGHSFQPPHRSVLAPVFNTAVMNGDGSGKRILARKDRRDTEEWDSDTRWSPDGTSATFVRYIGLAKTTLYHVRADGTGRRALTNDAPNDGVGVWSPDGRTIAFPRYWPGESRSGLWLVEPDGTGLRQLTQGFDLSPRWSPDGRTIAFGRVQLGREAILTVRTDGTGLRQLTEFGRARIDQWSADGQLLLYESGPDERPTVQTIRPDGSGKRPLVEGEHAAWSPDGTHLVFGRRRYTPGSPKESLFLADPLGRRAQLIYRGTSAAIWSRDGTRLAFAAYGDCNGLGVYVLRLSDRRARRISNDCRVVGTPRSDRLGGTRERDLIWGRGGDDFIDASPGNPTILWAPRLDHNVVDGGRGNDRILGRRGQDVLIGGPGRDEVSGGGQDDRILVRDGEVDVVRCGWGNADTVLADRLDVVAPDCERVHRR